MEESRKVKLAPYCISEMIGDPLEIGRMPAILLPEKRSYTHYSTRYPAFVVVFSERFQRKVIKLQKCFRKVPG